MKINIVDYPEVIEGLNAILNNKGIAEIKCERCGPVVVEIKRTLKVSGKV